MEWSDYYKKVIAAGGNATPPPGLSTLAYCVLDCIIAMSGDRNANGYIPFSAIVFWGEWNNLDRETIAFFIDVIAISEAKVKEWHNKRST